MSNYDYLIKLLLIGDSGVGKSCMLMRFIDDNFSPSFITTIGIDYKIKTIVLDGKKIKLQIWDTAGQERFRTITRAYYRGAMGILLVYDVSNIKTLNNIKNWIKNIEEYAEETVTTNLIGNKCDLPREVTEKQGRELAEEHKIDFFETSAKSDTNVDDAFISIVSIVVKKLFNIKKEVSNTEPINDTNDKIDVSYITNVKQKCCSN